MDIIRGLTGSDDGLQSLGSYSRITLLALSRLLAEKKVICCLRLYVMFMAIIFMLC